MQRCYKNMELELFEFARQHSKGIFETFGEI